MRVITVKVDEDLLELLDAYAIKHRLHRSEAVREAIRIWIKKQQEEMEMRESEKQRETKYEMKVEKGYKLR